MNKYNDAYKSKAISLANRIGAKKASEKLGLGIVTIYRWKTDAETNSIKKIDYKSLTEDDYSITIYVLMASYNAWIIW